MRIKTKQPTGDANEEHQGHEPHEEEEEGEHLGVGVLPAVLEEGPPDQVLQDQTDCGSVEEPQN